MKGGGTAPDGWDEWRNKVLGDLDGIKLKIDRIDAMVDEVRIDIATTRTELRIKSGLWGALGGMIPILIGLLIWLVKIL